MRDLSLAGPKLWEPVVEDPRRRSFAYVLRRVDRSRRVWDPVGRCRVVLHGVGVELWRLIERSVSFGFHGLGARR